MLNVFDDVYVERTASGSGRRFQGERLPPRGVEGQDASMEMPETRYAETADGVSMAYQVLGDGPVDLVWIPGFVSHVEFAWTHPPLARLYRRVASFCRLILFDKRGTGMSDRVAPDYYPDFETRMIDVQAVMDAAGSERAVILGLSEGGDREFTVDGDALSAMSGFRATGYRDISMTFTGSSDSNLATFTFLGHTASGRPFSLGLSVFASRPQGDATGSDSKVLWTDIETIAPISPYGFNAFGHQALACTPGDYRGVEG